MPKGIVYDNRTGNEVDVLDGGSLRSLFHSCQYAYGHCLGSILNQEGDPIGWRFAKCYGMAKCSQTDIVDIIYQERNQ